MLDSEGREVRIGNEAANSAGITDLALKQSPVVFGRVNHSNAGLLEPTLDAGQGLAGCQWALMKPDVCRDANEGVQHRPAQVHWFGPAEHTVPLSPRLVMVRRKAVFGVEQKICIGQNHPCPSSSATANNSEILS